MKQFMHRMQIIFEGLFVSWYFFFQETSQSLKSDENNFVKVPYTEYVEQKRNTPKSGNTQINSNKTKMESNTGNH